MGQFIIPVYKKYPHKPRKRSKSKKSWGRAVINGKPLFQCQACGISVRHLAKHSKKCPVRPGVALVAVQTNAPVPGSVPIQGAASKPLREQYSRLVEEYNRECERLALMKSEIDRLAAELLALQAAPEARFEPGDYVRITSGPFENFEGVVVEGGGPGSPIKVSMVIFAKEVNLDLDFNQVAKII